MQEFENMAVTTIKIKKWGEDRNLHQSDPSKQLLKLGEEYGELCKAIIKGRKLSAAKDAIGDMYVVLTNLAEQLGTSIEECAEIAYEEIKYRKGKMVDGVFVKEADLHD